MTPSSLDRFAEHFERLRGLSDTQRAGELAKLPLTRADRDRLERMLVADGDDEDRLLPPIAAGASRLHDVQAERLGAWRLLREIGAGGMGTVFLAERADGAFSQRVAIKLLRGFPTRDGMRRLRQERQILADLDHPHIAHLLDGGESAEGQPWLAIEYVDGSDLLQYVAQRAPALQQRLELVRAMLDAVEHAHQRLVIHRDIKPGNVRVTNQGVVKLLDFGIARLIDLDDPAIRDTSTQLYSRGYASPEQREGRSITTASDIYSVGVLLREVLSGQRDEDGRGEPSVPALELDVELAGIIAKACAPLPGHRYASASEFRDDLVRYAQQRPVRAAALTRRYRLRKFVGRHRLAVAAGAVAVITLAGFIWRLDRERGRALAAEASTQIALHAAERDSASARASLDFMTDAFAAASPEHALSRQVSVRDLLDAARAKLDRHSAGNRELRQTMQRMLARLYERLGESTIALDLLRRGLDGIEPTEATQALRLADDYALFSGLLAATDDVPAALIAGEQASRWREQFAADDATARVESLQTLAVAHHRGGEDEKAIALLREAFAVAEARGVIATDLQIETTQLLASLLASRGECDAALTIAEQGLTHAQKELDPNSPDRLMPMRSKASALSACGRPVEAEALLRSAIELHDRVVASGGSRMMNLTNDLALVLNDLGRYREAAEMLQHSDSAMDAAGLTGLDKAVSLANHAGIFENAGDYDNALAAYSRAAAVLDRRNVEVDHQVRRRIERSHARTLGIVGQHARAFELLTDLRVRCARIEGEDSGEYAMLTWQLALVARRMGDPDIGVPLLDEAERRWTALVPPTHPVFAHVLRVRAAFARQRRDYAEAGRDLGAAIIALERAQASPVDLAIARSELADVRLRQGRRQEVRQLLDEALPVMRAALRPEEVGRLAAENLMKSIGSPP